MKRARAERPMPSGTPLAWRIRPLTTGNPILDRIALRAGIVPQMPRFVADVRPVPVKIDKTVGAKSKYALKGRTNGMPWDTTCSINESTNLDNGPKRVTKPRKTRPDAALMSAWQAGRWAAAYRYSAQIANALQGDDADDFRLLAEIALIRGINKMRESK
jgi:hypothetical protein